MENNNTNNINNIQKPISLIIKEAKKGIANAINSTQLHPTLLEMIVKELYLEIKEQATIASERENAEYERICVQSIQAENNDIDK